MDEPLKQKVLKSLDSISQNAHMLAGAFVVFGFIVFHHVSWLYYAIPSYVVLTALKEFLWDDVMEIPEIRLSSLKDFIYYQVGWIGALILYFVSIIIK